LQIKNIWNCGGIFDFSLKQKKLEKLRLISVSPDFWNDNISASSHLKKISLLEKEIKLWKNLDLGKSDIEVLLEFAETGETSLDEVNDELERFINTIEDLELKMILGSNEDSQDAIITIHPGAGGTESQDWAEMHAYGLLKAEAGVHRLVRISPFDSNSRRHTSFASVFVYPSSNEEIEIEIDQSELRIDTYRASGAGGQHVNKTDSAIRITHIPSGIVVQCQNERSQHKNKASAMKVLKARLYQVEVDKEKEAMKSLENSKMDIAWGSQIRSYVFHPYNLVKDHRTKKESGNVSAIMDGDIDEFIRAFLMNQLSKNVKKEKV